MKTATSSITVDEGMNLSYKDSMLLLRVVTVKHCHFDNNGAAIVATHTRLLVKTSFFRDNRADRGAAITALRCSAKIERSVFSSTHTSAVYGIIEPVRTRMIIQHSHFKNNKAMVGGVISTHHAIVFIKDSFFQNNSAYEGGAIMLNQSSYLAIQGSVFLDNSADVGGTIFADGSSTMMIEESTFENNHATMLGGSFYVGRRSQLVLNRTTVHNSSAFSGGAIGARGFEVIVSDSNMKGNSAESKGGGFYFNESVRCVLEDSDIKNNKARFGGAVALSDDSSLTIQRSIVSKNSAQFGGSVYASCSGREESEMKCNEPAVNQDTFFSMKGCSVILTDTYFIKSSAKKSGGALYLVNATLAVRECHFLANSVDSAQKTSLMDTLFFDLENLAISNSIGDKELQESNKRMSRLSIFRQSGTRDGSDSLGGGAIAVGNGTTVDIQECTFRKNQAGCGGALSIDAQAKALVCIDNCKFENNQAVVGGAIHSKHEGLQVHLSGVDFIDNEAPMNPDIFADDSV